MREPERTPLRGELLEAVRAIAATLDADAQESEAAGRLAKSSVDALVRSRLFGAAVPRDLGGAEADPLTLFEIYEQAARADGSAGWCLMIGATQAGIAGAFLPDDGIQAVFGGVSAPRVAGGLVPRGRAEPVAGGYRLSGRWSYGSGCRHADWMLLAAVAPAEPGSVADSGNPLIPAGMQMRVFVMPVGAVEIHDNWQVAGLKATASCDYSVHDAFVPSAFSFCYFDPPRRGGSLFRLPGQTFVAPGHAGVALGVARRALDDLIALATGRRRLAAAGALAAGGAFQQELAHAEARLRGARLLVLDALGAAWSASRAGEPVDLAKRAAASLAAANANRVAQDVTSFAFRAAGGEALYLGSPIQRCWRDACAAGQHFAVNDQIFERVGQVLLGVAPPGVLV